ncbi:hypothetical protein ACFX1S_015152 [Malus domestica]
MKIVCISDEDLIPTDLTVSSFSRTITRTYGILLLEVDLGSKQIMLVFFVMDSTSTYGALLGRDWIHQSLSVPYTLHQHIAVYHEEGAMGPGRWWRPKPDKPPPEVQDPIKTIDLGTGEDPRPIQISDLLKVEDRARIVNLLHEFKDYFA